VETPVSSKQGFATWQLLALVGLAIAARTSPHPTPERRSSQERQPANQNELLPHPAASWTEIMKRTFAEFSDDRVPALAASVTYYLLLALFPALTALVSLYGLFADPAAMSRHLDTLSGFLPAGAVQVIGDQLQRLTSHRTSALGFGFALGLAIALWSTSAGMKALFDALNVVYEENEKRGFVRLTLTALAFTLGAIVFLLISLGAVVVIPAVLNFVGLGPATDLLMRILRWPLLLVIAGLALALLYYFGPSRTHREWKWVSWGSATASVGWIVASLLFSWYVQNFGSYDKSYGSLGAVIGFMTWLWLSTTIFLIGAELNSEIEKSATGRDRANRSRPASLNGFRRRS
jgi:membrane protein